jgi:hypothetical protein
MAACPMYSLLTLAGTLKAWQSRYCQATYTECARYQLSLAGKAVPNNLMPSGALLRRAGKPAG